MSDRKNKANYSNNLIGERLRACRERMKFSQEKLSELVQCTPNYISMIELGERKPSSDLAKNLSEVLNVPIEYLLGQSNRIDSKPLHYAADDYISRDITFIKLLELMGNKIYFHIVPLYDGVKPKEIYLDFIDKKVVDYEGLEKKVSIDDIENISFYDGQCIFKDGTNKCEAAIKKVILNDNEVSIGQFIKLVNVNMSHIQRTIDDLQLMNLWQIQAESLDENIADLIKASRDKKI